MQIKPAFKDYKELWRVNVCTDHTNTQFDLVCFTGERISGYAKANKRNYAVMSDKLITYSNGTTGYDEEAKFRRENFVIGSRYNPLEVNGFYVYPVYAGATAVIDGGIRIGFIVRKMALIDKVKKYLSKALKTFRV